MADHGWQNYRPGRLVADEVDYGKENEPMKDDREKRAGLPSGIAERLADFTCRRRRAWLLRGLGEACLVLLLGLLLVAAIDAGIGLRGALVVVAGLACYAAALAVVAIRGLLPRLRRHSPTEVAHAMEQAVGGMEERLSSAVELAAAPQPGVSGWMVRRTIELADEEIGRTNPATLVDAAPVRLAWRRVLGPLAVMILLCAIPQTRPFALRALLPGIRIARPSATRLMVDPGNGRFAMGTPLTLVVEATPVPAAVDTVVRWDDGLSEVLPLVPDPEREGRFAVTFPALSQGFTYQVRGGDAESLRYAIQVDAPPRVERLGLRITPADPAQPPKLVEGGDADVPAGATVEMTAVLAGPAAAAAEVVREPGERLVLSLDGTTATGSLPAVASFRYRLRLVGQDGIVGDSPQEWQIRVLADAPPTVQLTAAGLPAGLVGRNEILPMDVEADDDRGLVEVKLVLNVGGVVREVIRLPLPGPGTRSVKLDVPLALRHVPVKVGETIEVSLAATDTGGQTSTTVPVNLTVMEGAPAATAKLAAALRGALDEVKAQEARLRTERQAWMELARKFRPEDADTNRGAALMAEQRLEALAAAVAKAAEAVRTAAKEPSQHAENTDVAAAVADSLADWARTRENILSNAAERVAKNHEPDRESVAAMRDLVAESGRELAELRRDLGILAARVEVEDLSAQAEVARARQERNRRLLEAVEGWNAEALRQKPDDRKNQDLAARMAELPADAVKTATDQLRQDYDTLAAVPKALQRMADDAGLEPLGKLAESMKEPGRKMEETSAAMAEKTPDSTSLEAVSAPANALAQGTKQARDALARDLQDVARRHRREPGRIGDLLAAAKRIEDRAQKIPELGRDRSEMEQDALRRQSLAMLQEEQKELASDAEAVSREFLARAADPEVALGERQSVFQAREKLRKDLAPALAKAAAALAQPEPDPARTAQAYRNAAKQADRPLNSAKQEERQAMEERKAALARDALDKLARSAATPPPAGNPAAQEVAAQKLDAAVEELAGLQQELGQRNEADTLAAAAEKNVDNQNAKALAEQLKRSARPEKVEPWKMNQELREEASRLRAEPGAKAQAADRLADAALKLDLTAEAAERRGHREDGRAYRQVGDDLAALLAKPEALSPEALDPLAERVDAIENRRGDPARKEELARAAAREEQAAAADPALARMQELAALAEQAKRAMDRVEERQPLAQELARVAADPAQASAEAAAAGKALAEKLAQDAAELADLARAAAKAESMHQAERAEFAKTEQAVAQSLRGLSPEAQQAADVAQRQPLRDALAKAKGELPKLADHISRLGESAQPSAAQPDASTQAPQVQAVPPDSRQLADEARRQADAMSQSMTKPLAESVIQPGAAHPGEPANPKVEALGKAMANLTAEQRRAADRLERRAEGAERTGTELIERLQAAEQAAAAARAMLAEQGIPPPTPSLPEGEAGLAAPLSPVQRAHMASRDLQAMAAKLAGSPPAAPPPDAPGEAPAPQEVASKNAPPPAATPSSAQAAQEALAAVAAAPAQRQSYQQAADILNRAASQQRSKRAMAANPAAAAAKAETAAAKAQGLAQGVNREHAGTDPAAIASDAPVGGADGADWARLSRRLRTDIHGGAADAFPEEHREPIRAYFRRLAEEKQ
jgi:hypothetical protein